MPVEASLTFLTLLPASFSIALCAAGLRGAVVVSSKKLDVLYLSGGPGIVALCNCKSEVSQMSLSPVA